MKNSYSSRRNFVGALAGATGLLAAVPEHVFAGTSKETRVATEADAWFDRVKGSHRIVYDAPEPHNGFPIIWTWVYYTTNNQTGSADNDLTAMVILRHNAIPLAMEDRLWAKYKLGEFFKINDNNTDAAAVRNPYWTPKEKDFPVAAIEGMKRLQERGALFCVCDMALTVMSGFAAQSMNLNAEEVKKDWLSGILPGVQVVPSGVWAVSRAQEKNCAYCYAGG
jgi:intracellular sulfur oxidation DsrE/DsrF family protein